MSKMLYVLVRNPASSRFQLVWAQFEEVLKVGDPIVRDPKISGSNKWLIAKIYDDEQQRLLEGISNLIGFAKHAEIINVNL